MKALSGAFGQRFEHGGFFSGPIGGNEKAIPKFATVADGRDASENIDMHDLRGVAGNRRRLCLIAVLLAFSDSNAVAADPATTGE